MENIENPMVMPSYEFNSKHIDDDIWAEMEDITWDDYNDDNF